MIPVKKKKIRIFVDGVQQALCETALTEYAEGNGVVRIGFADLARAGDLFLQRKIHRGVYRLAVVLAFTGKYPLVLLIQSHDINLCIAVKIIQTIRADAGRRKRHLTVFAELCKDVLADVLISKCHEFLDEVLLDLVQNDLHIVQFQLALVRIHIAKPKADKVVCDEV